MDAHSFEIGDGKNGDVKSRIICSDGVEYEGNPVHLHSHVLNKSKFFQARLSDRWSLQISPPLQIKLTVLPNGAAENYIKCIRLMYSSYKGTDLNFSGVDEALDIFPVASELLFEEGIQACMHYLEAVPWTPQQTLKIKSLLSSPQVRVSADLSARLGISNSSLSGELELLKKKLPQIFSIISRKQSSVIPLETMRLTMEQHLIGNFQDNAFPAMQEVCRDAILNEFDLQIGCIKNVQSSTEVRESACENLLWLLDVTKLCNFGVFETTLKMFVEDSQLADILVNRTTPSYYYQITYTFSRSFSGYLLQILVDRFMKGLANGDIIVPKSFRISFLRMWVPVMAYHICNMLGPYGPLYNSSLEYSERFVEDVTKVVGTLALDDQKALFMFWTNCFTFHRHETRLKEAFEWWTDAIWLAVTSVNKSSLGIE